MHSVHCTHTHPSTTQLAIESSSEMFRIRFSNWPLFPISPPSLFRNEFSIFEYFECNHLIILFSIFGHAYRNCKPNSNSKQWMVDADSVYDYFVNKPVKFVYRSMVCTIVPFQEPILISHSTGCR